MGMLARLKEKRVLSGNHVSIINSGDFGDPWGHCLHYKGLVTIHRSHVANFESPQLNLTRGKKGKQIVGIQKQLIGKGRDFRGG